jgi:hypothetical protein
MLARALFTWGRLLGLGLRSAGAEEERRIWERFPCSIATTCQPANKPAAARLAATVQDISRGGASIAIGEAFEPGELLSMELPSSAEGPASTVTVLACVVRAEARATGEWLLGCTFAAELSDDDLQRFGARRSRPAAPDQRGWERFSCQAHASYQPVRAPESAPSVVPVLNISASGIALRAREPLPVGELLSIELRGGDDRVVLTTLASIVRVAEQEGAEYVIGCNFIHELGEAELAALL